MNSSTLFGAPTGYSEADLELWIRALEDLWWEFAHAPTEELGSDLKRMSAVFGYGVSPRSIRARLAGLNRAREDAADLLPDEVVLRIAGVSLMTPEGRILLEVLRTLRWRHDHVISQDLRVFALEHAVAMRSDSFTEWIRGQVGGTLSPAPLGAAVFLLVNGSIGLDRAFFVPTNPEADLELGAVVMPILAGFSEALHGQLPESHKGIRRHWAFTQVTRHLSQFVVRERAPSGALIYVPPESEKPLIRDLRGRLSKYRIAEVEQALGGFQLAFRQSRGRLMSLGVTWEEPAHTRKVLRGIVPREAGVS